MKNQESPKLQTKSVLPPKPAKFRFPFKQKSALSLSTSPTSTAPTPYGFFNLRKLGSKSSTPVLNQQRLWGSFHIVLFNIVIALLAVAHLRAVLSDPGLVPLPQTRLDFSALKERNEEGDENGTWTVCSRCEAYRPPRAHHCRICNRCIRRMDHHCPWINNCVGEWNQKYFMQFLLYVGILSAYAAALVVYSWSGDCPYCPKDMLLKQSRVLHSVLLMLESLLFGMFVVAIMIDQLSAVFSDETAVEHAKKLGRHRPRKPKMALLGEICGRGPVFMWLLPCHNGPQNFEPMPNYHV